MRNDRGYSDTPLTDRIQAQIRHDKRMVKLFNFLLYTLGFVCGIFATVLYASYQMYGW